MKEGLPDVGVSGLSSWLMIPLATSGTIVIGVAVGGAVLLTWVLLRAEARDDAREAEGERDPSANGDEPAV